MKPRTTSDALNNSRPTLLYCRTIKKFYYQLVSHVMKNFPVSSVGPYWRGTGGVLRCLPATAGSWLLISRGIAELSIMQRRG